MRTPANERLFAARTSNGWFSQEKAAEEVSKAGAAALGRPGYAISVRTYRAWESKNPRGRAPTRRPRCGPRSAAVRRRSASSGARRACLTACRDRGR